MSILCLVFVYVYGKYVLCGDGTTVSYDWTGQKVISVYMPYHRCEFRRVLLDIAAPISSCNVFRGGVTFCDSAERVDCFSLLN